MLRHISLFLLLILSPSAWATTYYVRDGGGTATQCTGTTNAVYTTGSGQPCAYATPVWVTGGGFPGSGTTPKWVGGDTMSIDGDSDLSPGTQAVYQIGFGMPNTSGCGGAFEYACNLNNIPAGTDSSHNTRIIGTGTNKPKLLAYNTNHVLMTAQNNHLTIQNIELASDGSGYDGLLLSGDDITLTDVYLHNFEHYVIDGGAFGSATFTRVWAIGGQLAGIQIGADGTEAVTGTLTFNQPIVEWNGCVEAYPLTHPGIDNPLNYSGCKGQADGGYGDGLAFGATGGAAAGNITIVGPGSISFNTSDGFDWLHGDTGTTTEQIDKMRLEGNAGQQLKMTGFNDYITNNVIIGDCGWWFGASQTLAGAMQPGDSCRAAGDTILVGVENSSTIILYNNTILTNGIGIDYKDNTGTGCNSSTSVTVKNNLFLGGYYWLDDTTWNGAGGNSMTTYIYAAGNDGNGSGTCGRPGNGSGGLLTPVTDYNVVSGNKNSNFPCGGAHDKCGTGPGFAAGTFPMGTSGGPANTYYQGQAGVTLIGLAGNSAAVGAGVAGLSYWNNSNDYYNTTFANVIGALNLNSCAVNTFQPCFFNTDCCSGVCSVSTNTCTSGTGTTDSFTGNLTITGITFK